MSDTAFYLAIIFVFAALPAAFLLGLHAAAAAIGFAPRLLRGFGLGESPFAARAAMTALIFVPLTLFWPSLALLAAGIAALLLPVAIVLVLLVALFAGFAAREVYFGATFWRFAKPVPLLCAAFVAAMIPIALIRYQASQEIVRGSAAR